MVARAHPAGWTPEAVKAGARCIAHVLHGLHIGREFIIGRRRREGQVMRVHMAAGRNIDRGMADELAILDHRLPGGNRGQGQLVTARNTLAQGDTQHGIARLQGAHGGGNIVGIIKPDGIGGGHV
jgi:hypothetical protein